MATTHECHPQKLFKDQGIKISLRSSVTSAQLRPRARTRRVDDLVSTGRYDHS